MFHQMFFFSALCGYAFGYKALTIEQLSSYCPRKPFEYEVAPVSSEGFPCIGGDGGDAFSVHYHGQPIEQLYVWTDTVDDHTIIKAIQIQTFADKKDRRESKIIGNKPAHEANKKIRFSPGELIKGDITLGGSAVGTRVGYISFNTWKGQAFKAGELHRPYMFEADHTMLSGFFGRSGNDIDLLGLYLVKPVEKVTIEKIEYPDLDSRTTGTTPKIIKFAGCNDEKEGGQVLDVSVKYSMAVGSSSKWGVSSTDGLQLATSATVKAGIPEIAEASITSSFKWTVSKTDSHERSKSTLNTTETTIALKVSPRTKAVQTCQWFDSKIDDLRYTGKLVLTFKDGTSWSQDFSSTYDGVYTTQYNCNRHVDDLKEGEKCSQFDQGVITCMCIPEPKGSYSCTDDTRGTCPSGQECPTDDPFKQFDKSHPDEGCRKPEQEL